MKRSPRDAQAYTEIVNLHRVQGDYAAARRACEAMQDVAAPAQVLVAQIPLDAVTGRAEETYHALAQLRPVAEQQLPELLPWVTALQAGVARPWARSTKPATTFNKASNTTPPTRTCCGPTRIF